MSRLRVKPLLLLLSLWTVVATWPVARFLASRVPGSDTWAYDEYTFIWSMWWFKHAALDLHHAIFFSQNIFYPLGMELILYSYNLMAAILALPLGLAVNWPFASNVLIGLNMVFSGLGAYLLAVWGLGHGLGKEIAPLNHRRWAGLVAALIYAFASNRMVYLALGHYNIQSWMFLPYFLLYLLRAMRRPTWHNTGMAGLFAALNLLVDMQYGVFMAFLGLSVLLARPVRQKLFPPRAANHPDRELLPMLRRWAALIGMGMVAVGLTFPYFWETVKSMLHAGYLLKGWGDALKLSADLVGWFTPTALHPVWGTDWPARLRAVQEGTAPFRDVNTVFLGYVTLGLALIGAGVLWRRNRGWIAAAVWAALFTLGPLLQIHGRWVYDFDGLKTSIPMPFILLHYIPFVKGNRTANRWSIPLMLALAMLAAWGMYGLLQRWAGREPKLSWQRVGTWGLTLFLAGGLLFEHAAMPLPTTDARIPPAIQQLAQAPEGAVWPIPMGWRNSFGVLGVERTQAQYYMTAHHKPIISGNTSRNPPIKFAYFARLPLVQALVQAESGHPVDDALLAAARAQAQEVITLWGVRYLMLLPPVPGRLPYADTWQASQRLALELIPHSPEPIIDDGSIRIYQVEPGPPLPLRVDFGAQSTDLWRAEGWGPDEPDVGGADGVWITAPRAHFLFRSEDDHPRTLRLRAQPFTWPGAEAQSMTVELNGHPLEVQALPPGWSEYAWTITPRPGINHLWFSFQYAESPRDKLHQAMIGTTGVQSPVNIAVHAFDQAYITLTDDQGEQIDASFGRRGYNVTLLDPETGRVVDKQGFDTVANSYEVARLVDYLNQLPPGQIVILVTREGAGAFISPDLVQALQRVGSAVTSAQQIAGQAHALVGVVAAGPGTAAEKIAASDAYLDISGDFRTLAAAIDWLAITAPSGE